MERRRVRYEMVPDSFESLPGFVSFFRNFCTPINSPSPSKDSKKSVGAVGTTGDPQVPGTLLSMGAHEHEDLQGKWDG